MGFKLSVHVSTFFSKGFSKNLKLVCFNRAAHVLHQHLVVMQIMNSIQARTQNLTHLMQMMQIGTGKVLAGVASAVAIKWL